MTEVICKNCGHGRSSHKDNWGGICVGCPCPGFEPVNAAESLPAAPEQKIAVCPKCNRPHYNMEDSEFCQSMYDEEETPCPKREDGLHCNCWYDGNPCCACGDGKPKVVAEPKPTPSGVEKFFGTWPGEESDQELLASLDEIRKPQPDSSSISTEQTFEEAWKAIYPSMCDMTFAMNRAFKEVGEKLWAAAKGQSNGR